MSDELTNMDQEVFFHEAINHFIPGVCLCRCQHRSKTTGPTVRCGETPSDSRGKIGEVPEGSGAFFGEVRTRLTSRLGSCSAFCMGI